MDQANQLNRARVTLREFILATYSKSTVCLKQETLDWIVSSLPGPCLYTAFPQISRLARRGNPSAQALLAAMPSPTAPPGGEP